MRTNILLIIPALFLILSCSNDDAFPKIENITKGGKWTLKIGNSALEVYEQLQELNVDKNFNSVNITHRKSYSKPEEIQSDISLYNSISLQTMSGVLERVLISFNQDKVSSIVKGGGLLKQIQHWPENLTNDISIHVDDSIDTIKDKLTAIYQIPIYQEFQIILPDKWLAKPFDPDMKNYDEWAFTFSVNISSSKNGRNNVRLYFKNNRLVKIRNEYEEFELVI